MFHVKHCLCKAPPPLSIFYICLCFAATITFKVSSYVTHRLRPITSQRLFAHIIDIHVSRETLPCKDRLDIHLCKPWNRQGRIDTRQYDKCVSRETLPDWICQVCSFRWSTLPLTHSTEIARIWFSRKHSRLQAPVQLSFLNESLSVKALTTGVMKSKFSTRHSPAQYHRPQQLISDIIDIHVSREHIERSISPVWDLPKP